MTSCYTLLDEARRQQEWKKNGIVHAQLLPRHLIFLNAHVHSSKRSLHMLVEHQRNGPLYEALFDPTSEKCLLDTIDLFNAADETPLMVAVNNNYYEGALLLLMFGASVNCRKTTNHETAFHLAARHSTLEMVTLLYKYKADHRSECRDRESWRMVTAKQIAQSRIYRTVISQTLNTEKLREAQNIHAFLEEVESR